MSTVGCEGASGAPGAGALRTSDTPTRSHGAEPMGTTPQKTAPSWTAPSGGGVIENANLNAPE
jgi:hypothetical protein